MEEEASSTEEKKHMSVPDDVGALASSDEKIQTEQPLNDVVETEDVLSSESISEDEEQSILNEKNENILGGANDPFVARMQPSEISAELKNSIDNKNYKVIDIESKHLGRLVFQMPCDFEGSASNTAPKELTNVLLGDEEELEEGIEESKYVKAQKNLIANRLSIEPSKYCNFDDFYIKRQLLKNVCMPISSNIEGNASDLKFKLTSSQLELLKIVSKYKDLSYNERTFENGEEIRFVYTLHALNHVLKTRDKVMRNNVRLAKQKASNDKKLKRKNINVRDQGLVRPKVLILVPFRDSAKRIVEIIENIVFKKESPTSESKKNSKQTVTSNNVAHKRRFEDEYGCEDQTEPENAGKKAPDFYKLFAGNSDDCFKLGLSCSKNSLKLFTDFYASDIIIASPLGIRQIIQTEAEKDRDHDFLASIELLIIDQVDVLYMMNWGHIIDIIDTMHQQPSKSHDVDFSRVRMWSLNGMAKYYRQTLLFSSNILPEVNSVFNKKCWNFCGKVKTVNAVSHGAICQVVPHNVPIVFRRFEVSSIVNSVEDRLNYFIHKVMPNFKDDMKYHTLIFVPSYFDYTQVRNWFSKKSYLDFAEVTEYTKYKMMAAARDRFFHGDHHFLLYTERAHFYKRYAIKGIRHLIFYQIPIYPKIFAEICNLMQASYQNRKGGSDGNMSCTVLYNKYDIQKLSAVVGTTKAKVMVQSEKNTHMFIPGGDQKH